MRNFARIALVSGSLLLGALSVSACGGSVANEPATAQSASTAAIGANTHGPVKLMGEALGEVCLRPEQRAELEQMAVEAEARHESTRASRKELVDAVIAQIEAGKIDRAALQPEDRRHHESLRGRRPGDAAALDRMHAILDPAQREKFVDALQAKMKAKKGEHAGKGAAMREWATELKLTDAQRNQIKTLLQAQFHKGGERGEHAKGHAKVSGSVVDFHVGILSRESSIVNHISRSIEIRGRWARSGAGVDRE